MENNDFVRRGKAFAKATRNSTTSKICSRLVEVMANGKPKAPAQRLPVYQPFPLDALAPILREYADGAASAIGCDPALVALPALAVAMSCIGNSRAILLRRGWSEPAVLWAIPIVRSGGVKSAGFSAAVDPLMDFQMDRWDDYQRQKKESDADGREEPNPPPCHVTSDATIQAVGELLRDSPRGLLLARDELDGWFQSFTRHQKGGTTDRPHWLELHRARTLRLDRITRDRGALAVRRACCSICGTIQPRILARALDAEAIDAGLGARFLLAMPPIRKRVWTEAEVAEDLAERYARLLRGLLALPLADVTKRKPHFLELSPAAKILWVEWFNRWGEMQYGAPDARAAVLAKLEGYAARLALLHHVVAHVAVEVDDLRSIGEQSVLAGIKLAEWFDAEAERVYAVLRESADERRLRELVDWIKARGGETTARAVQENLRSRYPTSDDATAALDELVEAQLGEWIEGSSGPRGGRPSDRFVLCCAHETTKPSTKPQNPGDFPGGGEFRGFVGADPHREPGEEG